MKITTGEKGVIVLEEIFNPIQITSEDGPTISIQHRDNGIELWYQGRTYVIKDGEVSKLVMSKHIDEYLPTSNG